jgi:ketosteroid isomerase-like protein
MTEEQENVERVRRTYDLWNDGDIGSAWAELHDPNVEVTAVEGWPEGDPAPGIEAWTRQAQRLRETWASARVEIEEIRAVGADRVISRIRYVTETGEPGLSFDSPMSQVAWFEGGRIARLLFTWDAAKASAAAGETSA